jgi:hypothetical protein
MHPPDHALQSCNQHWINKEKVNKFRQFFHTWTMINRIMEDNCKTIALTVISTSNHIFTLARQTPSYIHKYDWLHSLIMHFNHETFYFSKVFSDHWEWISVAQRIRVKSKQNLSRDLTPGSEDYNNTSVFFLLATIFLASLIARNWDESNLFINAKSACWSHFMLIRCRTLRYPCKPLCSYCGYLQGSNVHCNNLGLRNREGKQTYIANSSQKWYRYILMFSTKSLYLQKTTV